MTDDLQAPPGYRLQPICEFDAMKRQLELVDDLAALVGRLAEAVDKPRGNTILARHAMNYLRDNGLLSRPPREA